MPETTSKPEAGAAEDWNAALAEEEAAKAAAAGDAAEEAEQDGGTDWGAAMAEQAEADGDGDGGADEGADGGADWGAAMAEQTESEAAMSALTNGSTAAATNFQDFSGADVDGARARDIDFILDIPVQLTVELGRTKLPIKNLLQLAQGSVVELDGLAGEPMDVLVNGCLIAQGEVVVVNDKFGIRLTDVITPAERIRKLNR
jgi:flagellar motor switch protein FliN